jgi:hypothetical protein
MLKAFKLTKRMLQDPAVLLTKVGAVKGQNAFPSAVFMNDKDYKTLTSNLKKQLKKEKPYLDKRRIETAVGMMLLNLGPVNLKNGVQQGFVLVDENRVGEND